jgi:glutaredoxin
LRPKNFSNHKAFVVESDLPLSDSTSRRADMPEVKLYTTGWSNDCNQAKRFLDDEGIFYEEIDIEHSAEGARFVEHANGGKRIVPTFDIDGTVFSLKPFDWKKLQSELERLGVEEE